MRRRGFLKLAATVPVVAATSRLGRLAPTAWSQQKPFAPHPGNWRAFEITTRIEVLHAKGGTRVWVPKPASDASYQHAIGTDWVTGNGRGAEQGGQTGPFAYHYASFDDGESAPVFEVTTRLATQDRAVDWSRPRPGTEDAATRASWTKPTRLVPTDGPVGATARQITAGATSDGERVRAIYDWVVTNTHREPSVRGCGSGDVAALLASESRGGKCADLNGLFVALVRSVGVPARDVYGIRVAPSAFGYRSLGTATDTITRAQHCRAEVYLKDYGWVAMDPADVAKVASEETGEPMKLDHPLVAAVRAKLFGAWEGNWVAFNVAHDVVLPHAKDATPLPFFMYPQCETAGERRDPLDPDNFRYTITTREIQA